MKILLCIYRQKYSNEPVPTLKQAIELCKELGLKILLDVKACGNKVSHIFFISPVFESRVLTT